MGNHTPFTNYHLCNIALYVYEKKLNLLALLLLGLTAALHFAVIPELLFYQSQLNLEDCQLTLFVDFP
jgi:hypothetical protein